MKILNVLSIIILSTILTSCSCNKDKTQTTPNTQKQQTETTQSSDSKVYKIQSVEKSSGENIAPNFTWDENGTTKSLSDFKGKIVLLNLWASWCPPCIKEMPALSEISEELKDKDFQMIGLNVFERTPGKAESFINANPVSYTIVEGNEEVVAAFSEAIKSSIEAIPTTFIINRDGKIEETIVGGRDKETFLKSINKYLN
ncbi:MAG: TlpA family protein disulfide reductase [Ignavibacteria bacterium]|nr:TlpA family protein disulfide reductase [Ignavibacteria bacterium]